MARSRTRVVPQAGEALVLRTWPFQEADLVVALLTREQGLIKGVARHALRSRRRFGGALEPGTLVMAHYAERPREDLVRLDSFEIVWSPLSADADLLRVAGVQTVLEILEGVLPEQAPEDNVYRLAVTVLRSMERHPVWVPVTYFCVWMCRLLGWWPDLARCSACGAPLQQGDVWWSAAGDGVVCAEDARAGAHRLSREAVQEAVHISRTGLREMLDQEWSTTHGRALWGDLGALAAGLLERHLQRRLRSLAALSLQREAHAPGAGSTSIRQPLP